MGFIVTVHILRHSSVNDIFLRLPPEAYYHSLVRSLVILKKFWLPLQKPIFNTIQIIITLKFNKSTH